MTNYLKIKQFILTNGLSRTYCQMYNNNPYYGFTNCNAYLDPETGQANINCDRSKSGFNRLVMQQNKRPGPISYWDVTLNREQKKLTVQQAWSKIPPEVLTKEVESLFRQMLVEIGNKEQSNQAW